jgi:hypothetical protein
MLLGLILEEVEMKFLLIANSEYQEESSKKVIGWVTKNPLSNCHKSPVLIELFIRYYQECYSLMTNPEGFLGDTGAEMWENRGNHFEPICKEIFGRTFDSSDFDDVILVFVPEGYEYKILKARNGNEEVLIWKNEDPSRTLKLAEKVDMDTL